MIITNLHKTPHFIYLYCYCQNSTIYCFIYPVLSSLLFLFFFFLPGYCKKWALKKRNYINIYLNIFVLNEKNHAIGSLQFLCTSHSLSVSTVWSISNPFSSQIKHTEWLPSDNACTFYTVLWVDFTSCLLWYLMFFSFDYWLLPLALTHSNFLKAYLIGLEHMLLAAITELLYLVSFSTKFVYFTIQTMIPTDYKGLSNCSWCRHVPLATTDTNNNKNNNNKTTSAFCSILICWFVVAHNNKNIIPSCMYSIDDASEFLNYGL